MELQFFLDLSFPIELHVKILNNLFMLNLENKSKLHLFFMITAKILLLVKEVYGNE